MNIKMVTFSGRGTIEKFPRQKFRIFLFLRPVLKLKHRPNMVFFNIFENPDMADVQIALNHAKIDENSKFKKNSKI